jgi:hypothetical protein
MKAALNSVKELTPDLEEYPLPELTPEQRATAKQVAQATAEQKPVTLEQARAMTPAHLRYAPVPSAPH